MITWMEVVGLVALGVIVLALFLCALEWLHEEEDFIAFMIVGCLMFGAFGGFVQLITYVGGWS